MSVAVFGGEDALEVKGKSFHQDELRYIVKTMGREVPAILVPEPDNPYDPNAVAVWVAGLLVGHLSRDEAPAFQLAVQRLMKEEGDPIALMGRIVGGERDRPSFEEPTRAAQAEQVRTRTFALAHRLGTSPG
ncbi:MAG: HIRAN domain-containing protein [Acidimicrobiia bacterium]|nr:HIRAN domain-containing protein [Acidimicrobiia bacterium]